VNRQADGPGLVRERPHDGLTDPPGRVGREPRAPVAVELFDRAQKPDVAFSIRSSSGRRGSDTGGGDLHDESEIGFGERALAAASPARTRRASSPSCSRVSSAICPISFK